MKFTILGELPDLNTYIQAERGNRYAGASLKKKATEKVVWAIKSKTTIDRGKFNRIWLDIHYFCKNKRKDKDNLAFVKKFIFDGLQKAGIIPNDGWKNIVGWFECWGVDKDNPRIEVKIKGYEEE